jgi:hypothetical protein
MRARGGRRGRLLAARLEQGGWGLMVCPTCFPARNGVPLSAMPTMPMGIGYIERKTVTFNNTGSPFPFGTIDLRFGAGPSPGSTTTRAGCSRSWAIDSVRGPDPLVHRRRRTAAHGRCGFARPDVAALFPSHHANAGGPAAQFTFDTTTLADGLHTIVWVVADALGVVRASAAGT